MTPYILTPPPPHSIEPDEMKEAANWFPVVNYRTRIPPNSLVIPRYCLPQYDILCGDIFNLNSQPLQWADDHDYIAKFKWYDDVREYTPKTYFDSSDLPDHPMIVKGETNSKKWGWNTKMFAPNRNAAIRIMTELYDDGYIGQQRIIFRDYVPLVTYEIGINGLPFTNEWRLFYLRDKYITGGYYWSTLDDMSKVPQQIPSQVLQLGQIIANKISKKTRFFALDIAKTQAGDWILIEVNCGTMSGLSMIEPKEFYMRLKQMVY